MKIIIPKNQVKDFWNIRIFEVNEKSKYGTRFFFFESTSKRLYAATKSTKFLWFSRCTDIDENEYICDKQTVYDAIKIPSNFDYLYFIKVSEKRWAKKQILFFHLTWKGGKIVFILRVHLTWAHIWNKYIFQSIRTIISFEHRYSWVYVNIKYEDHSEKQHLEIWNSNWKDVYFFKTEWSLFVSCLSLE